MILNEKYPTSRMERKTGRLIASGMEAQTGNWEGKNEK